MLWAHASVRGMAFSNKVDLVHASKLPLTCVSQYLCGFGILILHRLLTGSPDHYEPVRPTERSGLRGPDHGVPSY